MSRVDRERRLRHLLTDEGWVAIRASMGIVDLVLARRVALVDGDPLAELRFVQVKSTAGGPYERFGPAERQELVELAAAAGATAWLIWWPPGRGKTWRWIPSSEWPAPRQHQWRY